MYSFVFQRCYSVEYAEELIGRVVYDNDRAGAELQRAKNGKLLEIADRIRKTRARAKLSILRTLFTKNKPALKELH